ncbi:hypothetical protein Asp14428_01430 [Actinoplanes sp. NBRC 14428]|nr:hypothetical protein Asp14428_01430 [Actinoplanes sp. NBRC 14428]
MAILLALLGTVVAIGLSAIANQAAATTKVADYERTTRMAMQVKFRSGDFNGWQTAYAFDVSRGVPDAAADTAGARKSFLASVAAFRSEVAALREGRLSAEERSHLDRMEAAFGEFMTLDQRIVEDYRSGDRERLARADGLVAVDEIKIFNTIAAEVDALTAGIDADAAAATRDADAASDRASAVMVLVGILTVVVGALLAFVLIRSIIRPLGTLNERLAEIADGDGDLTQRLEEAGRDEITVAAGGFNRFAGRMQELVAAVAAKAREVSSAADELSAVSTQLAGAPSRPARRPAWSAPAPRRCRRSSRRSPPRPSR